MGWSERRRRAVTNARSRGSTCVGHLLIVSVRVCDANTSSGIRGIFLSFVLTGLTYRSNTRYPPSLDRNHHHTLKQPLHLCHRQILCVGVILKHNTALNGARVLAVENANECEATSDAKLTPPTLCHV